MSPHAARTATSHPARARRARPRPRAGLLAMVLVTALGCGRSEATGSEAGLTSEEFVEVMVELREAERAVMEEDSAQEMFVRRKAEILERHGTTEEEIRAFVAAAPADLRKLEAIWEEISSRLRRAGEPDPVPMQ